MFTIPRESSLSNNNVGDVLLNASQSTKQKLILETTTGAPPIRPYDPNEYPDALPFALQHTEHPSALPTFTATLTFLGGRRQLIESLGGVNQTSLVFAHKLFYPRQPLAEYEDRWEQIGVAAAMEVFKCVQVQRTVKVKNRSEVVGRVLAEVWGLCEGLEDKAGLQLACDEGGKMALRLWRDTLFPDSYDQGDDPSNARLDEKRKGSKLGRALDKFGLRGGFSFQLG